MGTLSIWHWLVILAVVMLLFGAGKVSALMGDVGKGANVFRREINRKDDEPPNQA